MCQAPAISANGKCIAFVSSAWNLAPDDTNWCQDVFVYDRETEQITRVSESSIGGQADDDSSFCDISGDGRYVVFSSRSAKLVPGDTNDLWDVFRHDRLTGQTIRVSVSSSGQQSNGQSGDQVKPIISGDGRYVLFLSAATNFIVGDVNTSYDAFLHDCQTGETTAVALISTGSLPIAGCLTANMSADARFIVYSTNSPILPGVSSSYRQLYIRDRQTGQISLVSSTASGAVGNNASYRGSVSLDGRYVAFDSNATNLVAGDANSRTDIFIKDRQTGAVVCASVAGSGAFGNNFSMYPEISQDGSHVTYRSLASNLVTNDFNADYDVFLFDRVGASLTCASVTPFGSPGNGASNLPEISATGRFVTFMSDAWDLVPDLWSFYSQIYFYDAGSSLNIAPVATGAAFNTNEDIPIRDSLTASDADDDLLTYSIVQHPTSGSLVITNSRTGAFTYTPNANISGQDTFTFVADDGINNSNIAMVTINVAPVNDAPVAQNASVSVAMNTPLDGTLSAFDIDGDPLTYYLINDGEKGSVVVNAETGAFTYTPDADVTGSDLFTFKVSDGKLESSIGTIAVTITDPNSAPVAQDSTYATDDTAPVNATMIATDANGDPLTFYLVSQPMAGTLVVNDATTGAFTYTPAAGITGQYSFTFIAYDGKLLSNVGKITFNVTGPNFAPVAQDGAVTTTQNIPVNGTLVATDANGDPLTYALVENGTKGSAVITNANTGAFTYTPNADVTGTDTFTFTANDGQADSNTATITVAINRINSAPVAENGSITTDEDTPVDGTLAATDSDGDPLTFRIISNGGKGEAIITDVNTGAFTYTPDPDANGPDTFTFVANDGVVDSNTATISVTIAPVGDAPVAEDGTATVDEDSSVDGTLTATDVDGDPLTFALVGNPTKGAVQITAETGAFTYTPAIDAFGEDTITFQVNDGQADSNIATVTITINPMNDMPYVQDGEESTPEDTPVNGQLAGSDPDNDPLTFRIVSNGTKGQAVITDESTGTFTYTPAANASGQDSFTFMANDGTVDSNLGTITVTISPVSDNPVAQDGTATTNEDTPVDGTLSATDADGDPLTYSLVSDGAKGSVQINATTGAFTYTPNANVYDEDTFTFKANDGQADSNTATVTITIVPVNDAPVAANGTAITAEDTPVDGQLAATDTENDPLTFRIIADGEKGHAEVTNAATGAFTYTPDADVNGQDTFTFAANDGALDSNTATITVTINPVNDSPVAQDGTATTNEDTSVTGTLAATDIDGDPLTFTLVGDGTLGWVVINAATGAFTYTPSADANGEDSFTFKANDGQADSNTATITITIVAQNDAPVAENGTLATNANQAGTGTLVANDIDGDQLTYQLVAGPAKGTVVVTNAATGGYRYTPNAGEIGQDSFTFRANDGNVSSNTAMVSVTISPIVGDNAPVITSITGPTEPVDMRDSFIIEATFTDSDAGDTHTARWNWGDGRTSAGIVNQEAHTVFGNHTYDAPGIYTVTLTVTDSKGRSDTEVYRYLYTYDPTVGYITGDGTFARPNGKASFIFDVRPRGDNPPVGQLTVQDRQAGLNIRVTSFSRLIIIGNLAFCQGSYRSGGNDYSVWLAVTDDNRPGTDRRDCIRIMIRNLTTGQVTYDTQPGADLYTVPTTPITSGRITIRSRDIF
ncbi:MAG: Ig-like domain-containing protein [Armatimonadota bacterium]